MSRKRSREEAKEISFEEVNEFFDALPDKLDSLRTPDEDDETLNEVFIKLEGLLELDFGSLEDDILENLINDIYKNLYTGFILQFPHFQCPKGNAHHALTLLYQCAQKATASASESGRKDLAEIESKIQGELEQSGTCFELLAELTEDDRDTQLENLIKFFSSDEFAYCTEANLTSVQQCIRFTGDEDETKPFLWKFYLSLYSQLLLKDDSDEATKTIPERLNAEYHFDKTFFDALLAYSQEDITSFLNLSKLINLKDRFDFTILFLQIIHENETTVLEFAKNFQSYATRSAIPFTAHVKAIASDLPHSAGAAAGSGRPTRTVRPLKRVKTVDPSEKDEEIAKLKKQLEELSPLIEKFQKISENQTAEIRRLEIENERQAAEIQRLSKAHEGSQSESARVTELEKQLIENTASIEEYKKIIEDKDAQIRSQEEAHTAKKSDMETKIAELTAQISTLETKFKNDTSENEKNIAELHQELEEQRDINSKLEEELKESKRTIETLNQKLRNTEGEKVAVELFAKSQEYTATSEVEQENAELRGEAITLVKNIKDITGINDRLLAEAKQSEAKCAELESKLQEHTKTEKELEQAKNQINALRTEKETLEKKMQAIQIKKNDEATQNNRDKQALRLKINALENQRDELKSDLEASKKYTAEILQQKSSMEHTITTLQQQRTENQEYIKTLQQEKEALEKAMRELQTQSDAKLEGLQAELESATAAVAAHRAESAGAGAGTGADPDARDIESVIRNYFEYPLKVFLKALCDIYLKQVNPVGSATDPEFSEILSDLSELPPPALGSTLEASLETAVTEGAKQTLNEAASVNSQYVETLCYFILTMCYRILRHHIRRLSEPQFKQLTKIMHQTYALSKKQGQSFMYKLITPDTVARSNDSAQKQADDIIIALHMFANGETESKKIQEAFNKFFINRIAKYEALTVTTAGYNNYDFYLAYLVRISLDLPSNTESAALRNKIMGRILDILSCNSHPMDLFNIATRQEQSKATKLAAIQTFLEGNQYTPTFATNVHIYKFCILPAFAENPDQLAEYLAAAEAEYPTPAATTAPADEPEGEEDGKRHATPSMQFFNEMFEDKGLSSANGRSSLRR